MNESDKTPPSAATMEGKGERTVKRWFLFYVLVPILIGVFALLFSAWRIQLMRLTLNHVQEVNTDLQDELDELKKSMKITADQLDLTLNGLDFANIQVDESQRTLRRYEAQLADARTTIDNLTKQSNADREQIAELQFQLSDMQSTLEQVESALGGASPLEQGRYQGQIEQTLEYLNQNYPNQAEVLALIVDELDGSKWSYRGISPNDGFDSSGLAAYVLQQCGIAEAEPGYIRDHLSELFPLTESPQIGDLVSYQMGYYMFYYLDQGGNPFVAGMTPLGVRLLRYDFARVEHIYRLNYTDQTSCSINR